MGRIRIPLRALITGLSLIACLPAMALAADGIGAAAAPNAGTARKARVPVAKAYADDVDALNDLVFQGKRLFLTDLVRRKTLQCIQYCRVSVNEAVQGRIMEAIRNGKKALHLATEEKQDYLLAYSKRDLASAYNIAGKQELALKLADEALEHQRRTGRDAEALLPVIFRVRGNVLLARGDPRGAVAEYTRALPYLFRRERPFIQTGIMQALIAAGDLERARDLANDLLREGTPAFRQAALAGLGEISLREGSFQQAVKHYSESIEVKGGLPYLNIGAMEGIGKAQLRMGGRAAAIDAYLRAAQTAENLRLKFNGQEFRAGIFGQVQRIYNEGVRLLMEDSQTALAWQLSERGRSRALLDMTRTGVVSSEGNAVLSRPEIAAISLASIQAMLPPDTVLIQYHVLDESTQAWVITGDGLNGLRIDIGRDELANRVDEFRRAIQDPESDIEPRSQAMFDLLVRPLALPKGRQLVFVTHDSLHYLPFQALHDGETYLADRNALSYAPSSGVLGDLLSRDPAKKVALVAVGNPSLEDPTMELPGAEREVKEIASLFPTQRVLLKSEATKKALLDAATKSDVLHIAAHSVMNDVDPMYSRILLSGADVLESELEAHEIYKLDLRHTRLVTLSSCESALGKITSGDEVWGFPRAFLGAGARSLLVSLWPVSDESTVVLMEAFYRSFKQLPLSESLRNAQHAVRGDRRFSHPFFWAAFNVIGDWR